MSGSDRAAANCRKEEDTSDLDRTYVAELEDRLRSQIERLTAEGVPARFDHSLCGRGADGRPSRHAIIGATLIIAAAVVVADVDSGSAAGSLLIVFAPLWLASAGLLGRR